MVRMVDKVEPGMGKKGELSRRHRDKDKRAHIGKTPSKKGDGESKSASWGICIRNE